MNRIDEFADKFQGWLAEWAEKRQAAQVSCGTESRTVALCEVGQRGREEAPSQRDSSIPGAAGIQPESVPEPTADDGYYDDEPLWTDSDTERARQESIKGR